MDGQIIEYSGDKWAEFAFEFNQQLTTEEIIKFAQFLLDIKPAHSRFKGVIMADNFLVSKDHAHTGSDDGNLISHNSLEDKGTKTHLQLENEIDQLQQADQTIDNSIQNINASIQTIQTDLKKVYFHKDSQSVDANYDTVLNLTNVVIENEGDFLIEGKAIINAGDAGIKLKIGDETDYLEKSITQEELFSIFNIVHLTAGSCSIILSAKGTTARNSMVSIEKIVLP